MIRLALLVLLAPLLSGCWIYTNIQGNGTVTGPNHNCTNNTGDCAEEYNGPGTETLTAEAGAGYTFSKWNNCPYKTLESCETLPWDQNMADDNYPWTVTATFKEQNPPVQAAQYTYNALGQRITKTVKGQTTIFQYDLDGNLMAEIDAVTGQPVRQHIHVNGEPVAQLSTNPTSGRIAVYYVHADHLGTPTLLTNQFGQVVADIEATPFGETYIDYAEVTHNRRFPGQYKDEETGLHYNYFRDYDPSLGRYVQSDPIGLAGGLNTYAYVDGNPIIRWDTNGLEIKGFWVEYPHLRGKLRNSSLTTDLNDNTVTFNTTYEATVKWSIQCEDTCTDERWTVGDSMNRSASFSNTQSIPLPCRMLGRGSYYCSLVKVVDAGMSMHPMVMEVVKGMRDYMVFVRQNTAPSRLCKIVKG